MYRKGFTLIELSIVIVIIGLIVAGVVAGNGLVRQAKLRSIVSDIDKYKAAINTFKLAHDAYPGDLSNATSYGYTGNGNGDGFIEDINTEATYAWNHMAKFGVINGEYTGALSSSPKLVLERNMPELTWSGVGAIFAYAGKGNNCISSGSSLLFGVFQGHVLSVGLPDGEGTWDCPRKGFLKVNEAATLDKKIDDGLADSGMLLAGNTTNTNTDGERCVDNTKTGSGGAGASFDFDETGEDCHLMFAF
jgi:prepilin-type N-terminal cleavage/methylation domain-containing protein